MSKNQISDKGAAAYAVMLESSGFRISKVELSHNLITDEGMERLARAIGNSGR
ncbi:MAG: hypothetical protein ACK41O_26980 [Runella zeae]